MEANKNLFPYEDAFPYPFAECITHFYDVWKLDVNAQAVTILTHCASLLDNRIEVISHGIDEKPILWACIIQESGTGKSAILKRHCKFLQTKNLELTNPFMVYETTNATYEALEKHSFENTKGIMIRQDEFEALIKGMDNYNSNGNKGKFNERWNGEPMNTIRNGTEKVMIEHNKINIMAFSQPEMMHQLISRSDFANGFATRFLYSTLFDKGIRLRNNRKVNDKHSKALDLVYQKLWDIEPNTFIFSEEADIRYTELYNEFYQKYYPYTLLKKYCGKLETYGVRIALVLHLMHWATFPESEKPESEIDTRTIEETFKILEFFMYQYQEMVDARSYDYGEQMLSETRIDFQKIYKSLPDNKGFRRNELLKMFHGAYGERALNDKFNPKNKLFIQDGLNYIKAISNETTNV